MNEWTLDAQARKVLSWSTFPNSNGAVNRGSYHTVILWVVTNTRYLPSHHRGFTIAFKVCKGETTQRKPWKPSTNNVMRCIGMCWRMLYIIRVKDEYRMLLYEPTWGHQNFHNSIFQYSFSNRYRNVRLPSGPFKRSTQKILKSLTQKSGDIKKFNGEKHVILLFKQIFQRVK